MDREAFANRKCGAEGATIAAHTDKPPAESTPRGGLSGCTL